jgi:hypothetical protein
VFSRARVDRGLSVLTRVWATDKSLAPDADDRGDLTGCRAVKNVTPWTIFGARGPGGSRTGSVVGVAMFPPSISRRTSKYASWQGTEDVCAFWVIRCIGPRKSLYLQGGLHVA